MLTWFVRSESRRYNSSDTQKVTSPEFVSCMCLLIATEWPQPRKSPRHRAEEHTFLLSKSFRSSHEMLESSAKFEMFSHGQPWPQHRGGNFSRTNKTLWIMNYTWGRLRTSTSCLVPCCYFSWLSPHFSPFLMFPWKCAERFFKSETLLIIWSSTTVTAQQLAVGECWAGLGLGCWVELETKVRDGFIVTLGRFKDLSRCYV